MTRAAATALAAALALAGAACDSKVRSVGEPTAQSADCERCHGYPPPPFIAGGTSHPTSTQCSACHPGTVEPDNVTIVPGGLHMNGVVDVTGGAGHALPYLADHPAAALANIVSCTGCHGANYGGDLAQSCNACHASSVAASAPDWKSNCTFCHGTRTADVTTATAAAAPPQAVAGATSSTDARVGAHQAHLTQGSVAGALPCESCHAVPSQAQALTHFSGNGAHGAIAFSTLATKGVTGAAYQGGACNVYCHGAGSEFGSPAGKVSPAWTSTGVTCTTCHGNPPASGPAISGQPAHAFHVTTMSVACTTCHPVPPGQLVSHVNGAKDVVVHPSGGGSVNISGWDCTACHNALGISAGHAVPFVSQHTTAALSDIASCTACHGADYGGGTAGVSCNACHATNTTTYPALSPGFPDWKTNCTFCHGTRTANVTTATAAAAPPKAVDGTAADQTRTNPKVGAHQAHLAVGTYANALPCSSCHAVPSTAQALTHFSGGAATVTFDALAGQGVANPTYAGSGGSCSVYCHGSGNVILSPGANPTPAWTSTGLACGACHATSPTSGRHSTHLSRGIGCGGCHGSGFNGGSSVNRALHIDGSIYKDPSLNWQGPPQYSTKSCDPSCHGRANW